MSDIICKKSERLGETYYETVHRSGLKITVCPKKFSTCYAVIGTKFGSADDRYTAYGKEYKLPAGCAHFLEHKLFENEDGISADERFAALGAEVNAYTTYNATRYLFSTTKKYKECIAELLRFVTKPYFTKENVKKEQGIIEQEIMMYADDPYETAMENCLRAMYRKNSVRNSICGSASSIRRINEKLLYDVYRTFYNPNNMLLSICGDIRIEEVIEIADRELPTENTPYGAVLHTDAETECAVYKEYTEKRMRVARPMFFLGIKDRRPIDNGYSRIKRSLGMNILNNMLFSGTGEFYNKLLKERVITPGFSFGYTSCESCAMNYFSGTTDDPQKIKNLILEKASSAADGELDRSDFLRCKRSLVAGQFKSFDSSAEIADDVLQTALTTGIDPFEMINIAEGITFDEVTELAKGLFGKNISSTLSVILPL